MSKIAQYFAKYFAVSHVPEVILTNTLVREATAATDEMKQTIKGLRALRATSVEIDYMREQLVLLEGVERDMREMLGEARRRASPEIEEEHRRKFVPIDQPCPCGRNH